MYLLLCCCYHVTLAVILPVVMCVGGLHVLVEGSMQPCSLHVRSTTSQLNCEGGGGE